MFCLNFGGASMSKRGRKKGASGEQSRALLFNIAAEEFANNGFFETKISTIVKRAGVTQPTFYLYFKSKEGIYQELIDSFIKGLVNLTNESRLEPGINFSSLPKRISEGLTGVLTFFYENQNLTRIAFFNSLEAEEIKKQLAIQIRENLISEVNNGYFKTEMDMGLVAEILVGAIERLTITQLFPALKEPEEIASVITHLFLNGLSSNK